MKTAYSILIALSVAFAGFCFYSASQIAGAPGPGYDLQTDEGEQTSVRAGTNLRVMIASLVYYGAAFVIALRGFGAAADGKGGLRVGLAMTMAVALAMAFWSLLLPLSVSFEEVLFAWLATTALVIGVSIWGLSTGLKPTPRRRR